MRPGAKYAVIYRHRNEYPISVMCCFFQVSRSGYYDFVHRLGRPEKDAALAEIIADQRERSFRTYGYRRMWLVLEKQGIHHNPKTILRIMEKYNLLAEIRRRRKWVNMGQQVHKYENLLNRRFHADRPNSKWVTDISYIHTKQGVLYLSMIRDLYDNSIVAYKTGTQQTVNLVLDTIRLAKTRAWCLRARARPTRMAMTNKIPTSALRPPIPRCRNCAWPASCCAWRCALQVWKNFWGPEQPQK